VIINEFTIDIDNDTVRFSSGMDHFTDTTVSMFTVSKCNERIQQSSSGQCLVQIYIVRVNV